MWKSAPMQLKVEAVFLTLPGPTGGAYNTDRICISEKVIKMLHGRFVLVGKTIRFANFGQ